MSLFLHNLKQPAVAFMLIVLLLSSCFGGNGVLPENKKNNSVSKSNIKQSFVTVFFPGQRWNDITGNPINAHCGSVLYHEGTYYWYGEYIRGTDLNVDTSKSEFCKSGVAGISCYSSKDLKNWKFESVVLHAEPIDKNHDLYIYNDLQRPRVVYNERTGKFVMWVHVDNTDCQKARTGIAVSDSPTGQFSYLESFRPNGVMSRDQTLFVDNDGKAYISYVSEDNATIHISLLDENYMQPVETYSRILIDQYRKTPVLFRAKNRYYLLTSSGNSDLELEDINIAVADSLFGSWKSLGNPCVGPNAADSFFSQCTFVIPIHGKESAFIAMFDRQDKLSPNESTYVWLPILFENNRPLIPWFDRWDVTIFNFRK